jgi:ABC-type multidrug transport system ATPase subunit
MRFIWDMEQSPSLTIRNVTKKYSNGVQALSNISLTVPPGMYGLLGPNGAGKTTLMRILASLQEPDEGEIIFGAIDVINQKEELRKTLGYLPQEFGLLPNVTAESLLRHFAVLKGIVHRSARNEIIGNLLQQTNLWDKRKQKIRNFSCGMKQRLGVSIAVIGIPRLVIVDEPTAGLDPEERVRFLNLLSALGETNVVILSTHLVDDVSELCTNMAIIRKGKILLEAKPSEAVKELKNKIWRTVIDKNDLVKFEKEHSVISTKLLGGRTVIHVYSEVAPGNVFELIAPDLEDVYFCTMAGHFGAGRKAEV